MKNFKIITPYLKHYKKDVIWAIIVILVSAFSGLYQPKLLENIQKALMADQKDAVLSDGIWLVVLGVIAIISGIFNVYFAAKIAQGVVSDLREDTYAKIQTFSFGNIKEFSAGSLTTRLINDMNQVMNMMMQLFMQMLRLPILIVGSFIFCIVIIPRFWWAPVVMVALIFGFGAYVLRQMNSLFTKFQEMMDRISNQAQETLQGVRVVKSFNQGPQEIKKFDQTSDQLNDYNIVIGYWFSAIMPAFQMIAYTVIALIVYLIGKNITAHPSDIAVVSPFVNYVLTLLFTIMIAGMTLMQFSRANISLGRIREVLETEPDVKFVESGSVAPLSGSVELDHVSFTYPDGDDPTLKDISFKIKPGQMVGIVGATGAGKSTLAQLIARLYDPTKGEVKIGGQNIKDVTEAALRKTVSFVLQRAVLFSGTIASNLRQGNAQAKLHELQRAANMAQASEFIERYNDSFDHEVEERSANFSGGQKQRLSIARGLIAKAPILILDDSTSALDAESEKKVQQALEHELPDTTTFIIAEKIVSVINADTILVLDDGKLVAQGTHEELLKTSPVYQEIFKTQKGKKGGNE